MVRQEDGSPDRPLTKRQEALLAALWDMFDKEGFSQLTIDEISSRLRCSKASLYRLAPSKDDLVVRVIDHRGQGMLAELEAKMALAETAAARLKVFFHVVRERDRHFSARFFADTMAFRPTREQWEYGTRDGVARLARLIDAGIESGEFRPVPASLTAFIIGYVADDIRRGDVTRVTGVPAEDSYDDLLTFVLCALNP